jgi:hypothetical protein
MKLRALFVPVVALLILVCALLARRNGGGAMTLPPEPGSLPAHRFEKVAEEVYSTATG